MFKDCPVNKYGQAILTSDKLMELVLQGKNIHHLNVSRDDDLDLFLQHQDNVLSHTVEFLESQDESQTIEEFHKQCSDDWMIPEDYRNLDIKSWLLEKCTSSEQVARVELEYAMYEERGLTMLLRAFVYLVDFMRANRVIWGVGRGSAVSSYLLFLIGVHKVDSLKYDLPVTDFLKETYG